MAIHRRGMGKTQGGGKKEIETEHQGAQQITLSEPINQGTGKDGPTREGKQRQGEEKKEVPENLIILHWMHPAR